MDGLTETSATTLPLSTKVAILSCLEPGLQPPQPPSSPRLPFVTYNHSFHRTDDVVDIGVLLTADWEKPRCTYWKRLWASAAKWRLKQTLTEKITILFISRTP